MKKGVFIIALMAALAFAACTQEQQYCPESDFRVEPVGGGRSVRIVEYLGQGWLIRIPPEIGNLPVTHIGANAFPAAGFDLHMPEAMPYIRRSVTIPDSVIYIGERAFYRNELTSLTIGKGVAYIGEMAFASNPRLISVTVPSGVTIAANAFDSRVNVVRDRGDVSTLDFTGVWISTIEGAQLTMVLTRNTWTFEIPAFGFLAAGILTAADSVNGIDGRFYEDSMHMGTAFFSVSANTITVNLNANADIAPNHTFVAVRP